MFLLSGGHCLLAIARDIDDFLLLGNSKDRAPGEILDKVGKTCPVYTSLIAYSDRIPGICRRQRPRSAYISVQSGLEVIKLFFS